MNARIDLPVSDAVRRGLAEGVPLTLELDLDIERVRQLLPNSRVAELTQRYHLQYNAVSARYILRNDNSGQQESLGDRRCRARAAVRDPQPAGARQGADRSRPPLRGQRARQSRLRHVPFTLRLLMFWVSDWHRESDWYTWTLQP